MSLIYCEDCSKQIDTDFDAEHVHFSGEVRANASPKSKLAPKPQSKSNNKDTDEV